MSLWILIGGLNGLVAVAAGAWGWHGLDGEGRLQQIFLAGAQYQMWHALALLAVGWLAERRPGSVPVRLAGWAFTVGTVLFSGALYSHGLSGGAFIPAMAPVGGVCLMTGWAALIAEGARGFKSRL